MTRHLAVTVLASAALLGGCSAAEGVASDAASAATSQAKESAVRELRGTVCPLADRDLSESDRATLGSAIDLAQGLGVESELLTAAEDVVASDGTPPESSLAKMADACR
ncbi:hypothetical protein GCM10022415_11740 [Knoellia locipacati]|uniref:Lipoprotein n=1 Tax=Knoellia locipacati TaxID=882824 RepID=A0A512SYY0_9MICO|nr:hypothetical protein [Knoellia locipacati]GEQ13125.1 hypothetical protein KLO01_11720 [Knoellia locipacati]